MTAVLTGGCLCGKLRYRLSRSLINAGYCHCRMCQRACGAPVLAWLTAPLIGFAYREGRPKVFRSSAQAQREFCGNCGTPLVFRPDAGDSVDVTLASLDDPALVAPQFHIWLDSRTL